MRKTLKPLSSLGLQKDYWVIYELTSGKTTLITLGQNPSFPENSGIYFLYLASKKVRAGREITPTDSAPFFSDGETVPGREGNLPNVRNITGTWEVWGDVAVFFWLVLELITAYFKKNRLWLLLASTAHLMEWDHWSWGRRAFTLIECPHSTSPTSQVSSEPEHQTAPQDKPWRWSRWWGTAS